jgi:molecular chaperone HscB
MNYFELYGIGESFDADQAVVKRKFYELSKLYHPDFYINEPDEKQQEILELSTLNNKAYQVLSDPAKRMQYILDLHDLITEGEKYQLPQDFLMEMMDVNESLMELEFDPDAEMLAKVSNEVADVENSMSAELQEITSSYAGQSAGEKEASLVKIKDLYYRQKYLLRIRESLNKFI